MAVKSTWPEIDELKKILSISNEFFEQRGNTDVVSPHVLRNNYRQEGISKHFDRGLMPRHENNEYSSEVYMEQIE